MSFHRIESRRLAILSSALMAALTACSTVVGGMGGGDIDTHAHGEQPVLFDWRSNDGGQSGTISAALPDRTFTGRFAQITLRTPRESLAPFWAGWDEGWGDWPYSADGWDSAGASAQFTRYYSGKVVANLHDAKGQAMRCRFDLVDALHGMRAGAHGQCQLAGGKVLTATIDRR